MEGSVKELSRYRFRRAEEEFCTADILLGAGQFKASINRSYYSIFHALRSVTALDHFDSGKHSGVIAYFNRHYIKEGVFDKSLSKMIDTAYRLREKADYEDFFTVSREKAQEQLEKAKKVLDSIRPYLKERWSDI